MSTIRATCENSVNMENELIRLRQIETKCEQLQNALFTAIQKTAQVSEVFTKKTRFILCVNI